jgi:hypothetical protein
MKSKHKKRKERNSENVEKATAVGNLLIGSAEHDKVPTSKITNQKSDT